MTTKRSQARARRINEHSIKCLGEIFRSHFRSIKCERISNLNAVFLGTFAQNARFEFMVVQRVMLHLRTVLALGIALQQDGFRTTACANLQKCRRLFFGERQHGHTLRGNVGHQNLALRKRMRNATIKQNLAVTNEIAAWNFHAINGLRLSGNAAIGKKRHDFLIACFRFIHGNEQRRLLVRRFHQSNGIGRTQILDKAHRQPLRETVQTSQCRNIGLRIAEWPRLFQLDNAAQHGIRQTTRARRNILGKLNALIHSSMFLFAQKEQFVRGNAQSITHQRLNVFRIIQSAIDNFVKRTPGCRNAQNKDLRKCGIFLGKLRALQARFQDLVSKCFARANNRVRLHGKTTRRRCTRTLLFRFGYRLPAAI